MSGSRRRPSERTGEEGTLRWVVLLVALGVSLAAHGLASARPSPQPVVIAIIAGVATAIGGLALLHALLRRVDRAIEQRVRSADESERDLLRAVFALSVSEAREEVLRAISSARPNVPVRLAPGAPAVLCELAGLGDQIVFGLYTFEAADVRVVQTPAGWLAATHDSGHLSIIVLEDGRAVEWADDDPGQPLYREHRSLWHGLVWAIREAEM